MKIGNHRRAISYVTSVDARGILFFFSCMVGSNTLSEVWPSIVSDLNILYNLQYTQIYLILKRPMNMDHKQRYVIFSNIFNVHLIFIG